MTQVPAGLPLAGVLLLGALQPVVAPQWGGFTPVPVQQSHPTAVGEGPRP
jgi:hypothetical protein